MRLSSIDIVRGLVMVVMALDHVRDFLHDDALTGNPTDLATTTPTLFFTRWITHICAPAFVFLAGSSVYLSQSKYTRQADFKRFLFSRGLWLIFLELTVVSFAIWFDITFPLISFLVVAAIGTGMIALAGAVGWKPRTIGLVGVSIICLHNLTALLPDNSVTQLLRPLFAPGLIPLSGSSNLLVGYPPIPWMGILFAGYWCGAIFKAPLTVQHQRFLQLSLSCLLLFLALRVVNVYGDSFPWSAQATPGFTFLSFINVTKYPPSLQFTALMLSIVFLLLYVADRLPLAVKNILLVYGRVPLFYYVLHMYLAHLILFAVLYAQGYQWSDFVFGGRFGRPEGSTLLTLAGVYLAWLFVVAALYWPCKWYGKYKSAHPHSRLLQYL